MRMKNARTVLHRLYCSGGCAANAYHTTGSINGVYEFGCELHRRRIENAIMLEVARMTTKSARQPHPKNLKKES